MQNLKKQNTISYLSEWQKLSPIIFNVERVWVHGFSPMSLVGVQIKQFWRTTGRIYSSLKCAHHYESAIAVLGIYCGKPLTTAQRGLLRTLSMPLKQWKMKPAEPISSWVITK